MKFYVTFEIKGKYTVNVEADNLVEAIKKADREFGDTNFGGAEDIYGEIHSVKDENKRIVHRVHDEGSAYDW